MRRLKAEMVTQKTERWTGCYTKDWKTNWPLYKVWKTKWLYKRLKDKMAVIQKTKRRTGCYTKDWKTNWLLHKDWKTELLWYKNPTGCYTRLKDDLAVKVLWGLTRRPNCWTEQWNTTAVQTKNEGLTAVREAEQQTTRTINRKIKDRLKLRKSDSRNEALQLFSTASVCRGKSTKGSWVWWLQWSS